MIDVICLKWGDEFGWDYVESLRDMVAAHLSVDHRFVCMTDDGDPPLRNIKGMGLYRMNPGGARMLPQWWGKVLAFHPDFQDRRRIVLDLDTVIVDNIDFIAGYDGDFCVLRGFGWPFRYGSAVMSIAPDFGENVWADYDRDPEFARMFSGKWGDGHWIQLCLGEQDRWQDLHPGRFVSYKKDCRDGIPADAAVICFHGHPRPHELHDNSEIKRLWAPKIAA